MLNFEFKKCCEKCNHVDIDYDVYEINYIDGEKEKKAMVYCRHHEVCENFNGCAEKWPKSQM